MIPATVKIKVGECRFEIPVWAETGPCFSRSSKVQKLEAAPSMAIRRVTEVLSTVETSSELRISRHRNADNWPRAHNMGYGFQPIMADHGEQTNCDEDKEWVVETNDRDAGF
ncbi:hypothetical protein F0562_012078 [Nyssa sinensis]|uniref:Uncharacterized protein n=1 Tax=Nyssa sinensis TaxID=561372 RepID=A0A5J4ZSL2_9ASTE|nr:hypothetical protein F0562_012078 [Nyssa sinensis]